MKSILLVVSVSDVMDSVGAGTRATLSDSDSEEMSTDTRLLGLAGTSGRGLVTDDTEAVRGASLLTETQGFVL